jgi:nitrogen fixation/metabolism regulation signal transduction histidine kinase
MAERRISLQVKLAVGLLVIAMVPLLVAAYLIDQVGKDAATFRANEAAMRDEALVRSQGAYREYFAAVKELHDKIAAQLVARPEIAALAPDAPLAEILAADGHLASIALVDASGVVVAEEHEPPPGDEIWRVIEDERALPGGATLRLGFLVREDMREELKDLGDIQQTEKQIRADRSALPEGYQWGFLALLSAAAVIAIAIGTFAAQRVTRRIGVLVAAAREVAEGKHGVRAALAGRDEMAELAVAFNRMLDALDRQRGEIEYLQRIGAWQDVARKLAHEIKNPLTPIQLAVQQLVAAYKGDDERFRKVLGDTGEIVEEEIAGLRRLVDTFRTLGQLPRVEAHPLALREVVEDLRLDPALAERLHVAEPADAAAALTVRADKLLLKRVLANLVENGVHAGQEAGRPGDVTVTWGLAADRRSVAITVDDQGKGIAPDERERIFEPYVTTKSTGTGLGLAIAKKIALEHGGSLAVAPTPAPTGGARFVVTLPVDG